MGAYHPPLLLSSSLSHYNCQDQINIKTFQLYKRKYINHLMSSAMSDRTFRKPRKNVARNGRLRPSSISPLTLPNYCLALQIKDFQRHTLHANIFRNFHTVHHTFKKKFNEKHTLLVYNKAGKPTQTELTILMSANYFCLKQYFFAASHTVYERIQLHYQVLNMFPFSYIFPLSCRQL